MNSVSRFGVVLMVSSMAALGACALDGEDLKHADASGEVDNGDEIETSTATSEVVCCGVPITTTQWQTDLRAWQQFHEQCLPSVTVDGVFGPMTTTATKCFQRVFMNTNAHLVVDGQVGWNTFEVMCDELETEPMNRFDLARASHCP